MFLKISMSLIGTYQYLMTTDLPHNKVSNIKLILKISFKKKPDAINSPFIYRSPPNMNIARAPG